MARAKTKTKTGKAKRGRPPRRILRRLLFRVLRWLGYALGGVILWVGIYTVIPPLGGYSLARELESELGGRWLPFPSSQAAWRREESPGSAGQGGG